MVTERDTLTNEEIERILEEIRGVINGPENLPVSPRGTPYVPLTPSGPGPGQRLNEAPRGTDVASNDPNDVFNAGRLQYIIKQLQEMQPAYPPPGYTPPSPLYVPGPNRGVKK